LARGRSFTVEEQQSGAKVAVIGDLIAEELFNGASALGEPLRIGSVPFTIIGVLDKKGQGAMGRNQDDVVFIPLAAAKSRVMGAVRGNTREALDFIVVKVSEAGAVAPVQDSIKTLLRQRHQLAKAAPDDFTLENPTEVLGAREGAIR